MKNLILGGISVVLLSNVATPAIASEEVAKVNLQPSYESFAQVTPVNLVQLAYRGYFSDLGIPSHGAFKQALISQKIDAEIIVRSAITKGRLSSDYISNQAYLDTVNMQLQSITYN
ncbi:hypothetical protein [Cyanothece sp. BG0011]|uniref:hypothetical protein n=1 Tax=Cyanothece sp. BG0011 TaxID=2082950 RepID=UPI000D1EAFCB|nr:hypothetical protein [Cyanothece sp. BG0011]